jgi:hypothetical protein
MVLGWFGMRMRWGAVWNENKVLGFGNGALLSALGGGDSSQAQNDDEPFGVTDFYVVKSVPP